MQESKNLLIDLSFYIGIFILSWVLLYTQGSIYMTVTLALVIIGGSEVIATIFALLFNTGVKLWKREKE